MPTVRFSRNIKKRGDEVLNSATEMVRVATKGALASLVRNTKVDTGRARSSWEVGVGVPAGGNRQPFFPYRKGSKADGLGASETANANATIAEGTARINAVRGVRFAGLRTALYISNRVPYLNKALLGGGIEAAILNARTAIRGVRIFR